MKFAATIQIFYILKVQKRILSAEPIRGITVCILFIKLNFQFEVNFLPWTSNQIFGEWL